MQRTARQHHVMQVKYYSAPRPNLNSYALLANLPLRHIRKVSDDQIDLAIAQLVPRESGHGAAGPVSNRCRIANVAAQCSGLEVLDRIHRHVEVGASVRAPRVIEPMTGETLSDEQPLARANRIGCR